MAIFLENIFDDIYNDPSDNTLIVSETVSHVDDGDDLESISWIHDAERLQNISNNLEKTSMTSIGINFIYINKHNYIENMSFEKFNLLVDSDGSILSKESILKIIQQKKVVTPTSRYKLVDILSFIVDVDHEDIPLFLKSNDNFLTVRPIFHDIRIKKSVFIFNKINQLYFIFQEFDVHTQHRATLKSILKPSSSSSQDKSLTKKVRILLNGSKRSKLLTARHRTTRKKQHVPPYSFEEP